MTVDLIAFIKSSISGLIMALVFLFLSLLFLPESWICKVLNVTKPNMLKRPKSIFMALINLLINNNLSIYIYDSNDEKIMENIKIINEELKSYEEAAFIIDSIIGMFEMLSYILHTDPNSELYETTAVYFGAYCNTLMKIKNKKIQSEISEKFDEFVNSIYDIGEKYETDTDNKLELIRIEKMIINEQKKVVEKFSKFIYNLKKITENEIEKRRKFIIYETKNVIEDLKL